MSLQRGRGQSVCNTEIDWMEKRNCHNDIVWDHELGLPGIDVICDKYLHPEYHEVCVSLDDDEMDGGGGGYNPPSNPPETPPTPCKRAKTLSQDAAFKSRIKDVYRKHFLQEYCGARLYTDFRRANYFPERTRIRKCQIHK